MAAQVTAITQRQGGRPSWQLPPSLPPLQHRAELVLVILDG